jgi:hypothetical protein
VENSGKWGRSADALPGVVAKGKLGKRSVILALAAFAADAIARGAAGAYCRIDFPADGTGAFERQPPARLVGILPNGISLAVGAWLLMAVSTLGAFT